MEYIEYTLTYLHNTPDAVLVEHPDDGEDLWIPLSNIEDGAKIDFSYYERGYDIDLNIKKWFAEQEGLE